MRKIRVWARFGFLSAALSGLLLLTAIAMPAPASAVSPLPPPTPCAPIAVIGMGGVGKLFTVNLGVDSVYPDVLTVSTAIGISITPDGTKALVPSYNGGYVDIVDIATNTLITRTAVIGFPRGSVVSQDGRTAYVTSGTTTKVHALDLTTYLFTDEYPTNSYEPTGIVITPDGKSLIVAGYGTDQLVIIDIATSAIQAVPVGDAPFGLAITPDGTTAVTGNHFSQTVSFVDIATATLISDVPVGPYPFGVAVTPDGSTVVVANRVDSDVSTIPVATRVKDPNDIPVGDYPNGVAITPDGKYAITSDDGGSVTKIDLATRTVVSTIPIPGSGYESTIAVTPCGVVTTTVSGRTVTVNGSQWGPSNSLTLSMASTPITLGSVTTAANGTFTASYEIDCSVEAGEHTVTATSIGGLSASSTLTLSSCSVTPTFTG